MKKNIEFLKQGLKIVLTSQDYKFRLNYTNLVILLRYLAEAN